MNQKQRDRLRDALIIIDEVCQEEEEKIENMSYSFSETEKYQEMEEKKDELDEIRTTLEEIVQ